MRPMRCGLFSLLLLLAGPLFAGNLFLVRTQLPFSQAEMVLQEMINNHGYVVSGIQQVDLNLVSVGFSRGDYRVVYYGKPKEIRELSRKYPELVPFLPLQIVLFSEQGDTLVSAINPVYFEKYYSPPELVAVFEGWGEDLRQILEAVRDRPPK